MFGEPLQPRLLDFEVLDFLLPVIHEPLALQTAVEESALANVGFHHGDAIGLARDRLRGEPGGKGADIELPLRRVQDVVDDDGRARRRSRPELQVAGRRGEREARLGGELAQIEVGAQRAVAAPPGNPDRADLHDAGAKCDRRRPVRNRQRRPAELVAEGEGDIGLVERRVGGLRLGDHAIEGGRIASRQRRPSEVHRPGAGEPVDQRRGTAPGRGEIERSPEAARESRPFDGDRVDGRRSGQRRRVAVATERRMAGGGASRNLHLEVVEIEPALVEAQRGCEALRRESVGEVERSDLELDGGGRRAQRRGGEFRLRPAGSRPARLGRPKRERQNAGHRQAVDGELAFDLRRRRRWRPRGSRPRAKRLLGAGDRGARLSGGRERRDGVIGQLATGLDPGNRRRELRERPPIAAQGGVESNIGRSERAAVGGRKAERGRDRGKVRRLDLGDPKQLRVVALRLRQEAAAPRQLRAGERRRRIDVVALRPSARRVERNMPAPASRRRRTQAELPQQRARVWGIEADS